MNKKYIRFIVFITTCTLALNFAAVFFCILAITAHFSQSLDLVELSAFTSFGVALLVLSIIIFAFSRLMMIKNKLSLPVYIMSFITCILIVASIYCSSVIVHHATQQTDGWIYFGPWF